MKKEMKTAVLSVALAVALAGSVAAQSGPPPPPPGPNGPVAAGIVQSVNTTTGKITVAGLQGSTRLVSVTGATVIATESAIKVSTLKVGDFIEVNGVPGGIIAGSVVLGDLSKILPPPPPPGPPSASGSTTTTPPPPPAAGAFAKGKVMSLQPLTISVPNVGTVLIQVPPTATINKIVPLAFSAIKTGDHIIAGGTPNSDGSLTALTVAINIAPPGGPAN